MSDIIRKNFLFRTTHLAGTGESDFQKWYEDHAKSSGLSKNPDDPEHHYDWRAAFASGARPEPADDGYYHWPSQFKKQTHPNRFVDGTDTITGRTAK